MVALEISTERRPSNHPPGNASVDPTFESRECPVECRNHPWTFGATRFRSTLPRHHQEVYGQANEEHLKRLLKEFIEGYYHRARPHQGLHGDTPVPSAKPEPVADASRLVSIPVVGGLHHRYIRVAA